MENTAFFVRRPRRIENLLTLHALDQERPFEIVQTVALSASDYKNFISDMTVDRDFLESGAALCAADDIWKCLLIKHADKNDGILVIPLDTAFVGWAAYYRRE